MEELLNETVSQAELQVNNIETVNIIMKYVRILKLNGFYFASGLFLSKKIIVVIMLGAKFFVVVNEPVVQS